jgi:antitoxin component of MazEF toxin-antitoxin module
MSDNPQRFAVKTRRLSVARWGNGYGMRLPLTLLSELGHKEGDLFEVIKASPDTLVLRVAKGSGEPAADDERMQLVDLDGVHRSLRKVISETAHLAKLLSAGDYEKFSKGREDDGC